MQCTLLAQSYNSLLCNCPPRGPLFRSPVCEKAYNVTTRHHPRSLSPLNAGCQVVDLPDSAAGWIFGEPQDGAEIDHHRVKTPLEPAIEAVQIRRLGTRNAHRITRRLALRNLAARLFPILAGLFLVLRFRKQIKRRLSPEIFQTQLVVRWIRPMLWFAKNPKPATDDHWRKGASVEHPPNIRCWR